MPKTPSIVEAHIVAVLPGSIAEEVELQPGDVLLAVNGAPLSDYIAYRFAIAEEEVALEVARGEERWGIEIEKDADEDLGLVFASDVFDGVRRCRNRCVFCFEEQMPPGMRPSLCLHDDDFRLSFLHGNFLSLTNLSPGDERRIIREHLSPLFVSIHATDLDVRRRMLQNGRAPDIVEQLRRLGDGGITVHGQIVLCPGWNDGDVLQHTLDELATLYPTLETVGLVPIGLSAHRPPAPEMRAVTPADAAAVLDLLACRQQEWLPRLGTRLAFAADEFYLTAGRSLPPAAEYEDFLQQENGIGLARLFLDELTGLPPDILPAALFHHITLATGVLAAPLLEALAARLRAAGVETAVAVVPNHFYGGGVTVAGLLTGSDLLAALRGHDLGEALFLPASILNADGIFLDDLTPDALARELGVPLYFCRGPREVVEELSLGGH